LFNGPSSSKNDPATLDRFRNKAIICLGFGFSGDGGDPEIEYNRCAAGEFDPSHAPRQNWCHILVLLFSMSISDLRRAAPGCRRWCLDAVLCAGGYRMIVFVCTTPETMTSIKASMIRLCNITGWDDGLIA
jgi:hypothetical protein